MCADCVAAAPTADTCQTERTVRLSGWSGHPRLRRGGVAALAGLAVAGLVSHPTAQVASAPRVQVTWELVEDVFEPSRPNGVSRAAFTLTNRGNAPLQGGAWAVYFNVLQPAAPTIVTEGDARFTHLGGDLHRLDQDGAPRSVLAPGASLRVEYLTGMLITNIGEAPGTPYLVLTAEPDRTYPVEFTAIPFTRPTQQGRAPRLVTPAEQYRLNAETRERALEDLPPVLPTPLSVARRRGRLTIDRVPPVEAAAELAGEAALLREYLNAKLTPGAAGAGRAPTIQLSIGRVRGHASPEAYELDIDRRRGIRVTGNTAAGVFYGIQTVRALLPAAPARELGVPALRIVDAPRFPYRGLMLDVARNFHSKARVLRVLDLMARYKLNALHFHLTDDEGWRLEIPELPELTAVGARRGHTSDGHEMLPPAFGSGPSAEAGYGSGFYSTADYLEILRRAQALHIEVIPEIEMPGHARAAIRAMEARYRARTAAGDAAGAVRYRLAEPDDRSTYRSAQHYTDNVLNPGLESMYAFIQIVIDHLARVHRDAGVPLRRLHVGGDEVPDGAWERLPAAEAARVAAGAEHVRDLWFPFYGRVERMLAAHQIALAGWEEVGLRLVTADGRSRYEPNPDFANRDWRVYVWNNIARGAEDLAYRLANRGYQVVLTPVSHLYFDLAVNPNPEERGLHWGGYVDVDKPFQFIPLDYLRGLEYDRDGRPVDAQTFAGREALTPEGARNVIGLQGNLWSETLTSDGRLEEMLLPKLFGLAERAWAPEPDWSLEGRSFRTSERYRTAWSGFATAVGKRELPRLIEDYPGLTYRIPTPGLSLTADGAVVANLQLPGFVLRYTTDGSEPTSTSAVMAGPVKAAGIVAVAAFDATGRRGHSAKMITAGKN